MSEKTKILFIGAHHEEIEAECPNTAAALSLAGCDVTILNPVGGWTWTFIRSLGEGGRERTIAEATAAADALEQQALEKAAAIEQDAHRRAAIIIAQAHWNKGK